MRRFNQFLSLTQFLKKILQKLSQNFFQKFETREFLADRKLVIGHRQSFQASWFSWKVIKLTFFVSSCFYKKKFPLTSLYPIP